MINKNAIFSDGTSDYREPCEPACNSMVKIRVRLGKDESLVNLITNKGIFSMELVDEDNYFRYFEASLYMEKERLRYYFEIRSKDGEVCYYNRKGVTDKVEEGYSFVITPGFHTPNWAKGAVFYQIFVDRFFNGDPTNDVEDKEYVYVGGKSKKVTDWYKYPDKDGIREFYGGDLQGVIEKLPYLADLGIDAIYLNPIFVSPSNHKYDTQDYDYVDPHFGVIKNDDNTLLKDEEYQNTKAKKYIKRVTDYANLKASNDLLIELVSKAHNLGIKVILDGVFNHCGSFHKWLDREGIYSNAKEYEIGAFLDKNSPYRDYFHFREDKWPNNHTYDGWWGYDTLPKLNYEGSRKLYQYIMELGKKWVSPPYNCDGWRLDVAADLGFSREFNHIFWKDFRKSVKEANPDAIILAEHYGDPEEWLQGDEWDTIMNYDAFMEPVTWFLTGLEKHSDAYDEKMLNSYEHYKDAMIYHMAKYQTSSLLTAMNELSNHDHSRFLTRTNKKVGRISTLGPEAANEGVNKAVFREAITIQMTWPGAPTIYYGDEAGLCGFTDPDNRRTYPWGREDKELIAFHKDIIKIHKTYEVFKTGSFKFLTGDYGVLVYGRFNKNDKFIIAINNNEKEVKIKVNAWEIGVTEREAMLSVMQSSKEGYHLEEKLYQVENGILNLVLLPTSSLVLKNINNQKENETVHEIT